MIIRKANVTDIPTITQLLFDLNQMHQTHLPNDFKSPKEIAQMINLLEYIEDRQKVALVACINHKVIGFILGDIWERKSLILQSRKIATIMDIAIDSNYQGQGIGKQLFQVFERHMKNLDAEEIMVEVYDFNKAAITFYQSCGIKPYIQVGVKKL